MNQRASRPRPSLMMEVFHQQTHRPRFDEIVIVVDKDIRLIAVGRSAAVAGPPGNVNPCSRKFCMSHVTSAVPVASSARQKYLNYPPEPNA